MPEPRRGICRTEGCCITAIYNEPGNTNGIYCSRHRSDSMINVVKSKNTTINNDENVP